MIFWSGFGFSKAIRYTRRFDRTVTQNSFSPVHATLAVDGSGAASALLVEC